MKLFAALYERVINWSRHRHAPAYLGVLSFAEASFFPIPTDVMLAPMCLAKPGQAWRYAAIATITSVAGGLAGYVIGYYAFGLIEPVLHSVGYWDEYLQARDWFERWGFWIVFVAGFSPVPYKIFTITAGTMSQWLVPFVLASLASRGARYFLVAGIIRFGGEPMERVIRKYIDLVGWLMVVLVVVAIVLLR
ncbi:MAG: DedA family protein [Gammaproteobacteria bacterium]|nr:DedA family protein [Gammaproteobacteria bacterium]